MKLDPIPEWALLRARRSLARRVASALVRLMADTDTSFAQIAHRIGQTEEVVRGWLYAMIDGTSGDKTLDQMSDFALAMAAELVPNVQPLSFSLDEEEKEPATVAA